MIQNEANGKQAVIGEIQMYRLRQETWSCRQKRARNIYETS